MTVTLPAPGAAGLERSFAGVLGDVLGTGEVPADGHFFDDLGADSMVMARFCARVRKRTDLPSVSMRDIYAHPTVRGLAGALGPQASPLEQPFAQVLAEVLGVGEVPVDGHFFDDLGADSMVMARFCARVRKRADLPAVSMKDVYRHPTISSLASGSVAPDGADPDRCAGPPNRSSRWLDRWVRPATCCAGCCSSCASSAPPTSAPW